MQRGKGILPSDGALLTVSQKLPITVLFKKRKGWKNEGGTQCHNLSGLVLKSLKKNNHDEEELK